MATWAWLATAAVAARGERHTELNFIPFVGGDTDVGIGTGGAGDLSSLGPDDLPYRWRIEAAGMITFKSREGGGIQVPFLDYYMTLVIPNLPPDRRLRLELKPSYTDESTQRYYGIGNASPRPPAALPRQDWMYERKHAHFAGALRFPFLRAGFFLRPQVELSYSSVEMRETSILFQQRENGTPTVRNLLDGPLQFASLAFDVRLDFDGRDNELITRSGVYNSVRLRYVPPLLNSFYHFAQANLNLRAYRSFGRLTFSGRLVGDALVGNPPFYELTRIDESSIMGGGKGLRGVPGQRYYGKIKVYTNVEVRAEVLHFHIKSKPFAVSPTVFADGGRVWADFQRHPELDGTGLGLKYGVGTGIRVQQGTTFVVRAEIAWSPDAEPVGAYFNAGQLF